MLFVVGIENLKNLSYTFSKFCFLSIICSKCKTEHEKTNKEEVWITKNH